MSDRSADRHKYDRRYFHPEPALYERAKAILRARGANVNDYLQECLQRLVEDNSEPSGDVTTSGAEPAE